jgi:hypothetical protein
MVQYCPFQLSRSNLDALIFDQLLKLVGDVEVTLVIYISNISGFKVPFFVEGVGSTFRIIKTSLEDIQSLHEQLAGLASVIFAV